MRSGRPEYVFAGVPLREALEARRLSIGMEVNALAENHLLNTPEADLVAHFIDKNTVETPILRRNDWSVESREAHQTIEDYGRTIVRTVQTLDVHVPIDGEAPLLQMRPSTHTFSPPVAKVEHQTLIIRQSVVPGETPDSVLAAINHELDHIESYLAWTAQDVDFHNKALRRIAEDAVRARRDLVLKRNGLVAGLGIPLRERADVARTFAAPGVQRKVTPILSPASRPFKPEPTLTNADYEHILTVVGNMSVVMERNPATFSRLDEEALRDHFLVQLNGHYEGAATGETFNAAGKTDILIRVDGKNIFIAECKFWKGAKGFSQTIDQLLGYSSWRDSKTAIFVFNRNRDTSKVLDTIRTGLAAHPSFKRNEPCASPSGCRCVMRHPSDANMELILTVMAFDIPSPTDSNGRHP